jgi:hypothetical protein
MDEKRCPMCGAPVAELAMRCPACGETLQRKSAPSQNHQGWNRADIFGIAGGSLLLLMSAAGFAVLGLILLVVLAVAVYVFLVLAWPN